MGVLTRVPGMGDIVGAARQTTAKPTLSSSFQLASYLNLAYSQGLTVTGEGWNACEYRLQVTDNKSKDRCTISRYIFANWVPIIVYYIDTWEIKWDCEISVDNCIFLAVY